MSTATDIDTAPAGPAPVAPLRPDCDRDRIDLSAVRAQLAGLTVGSRILCRDYTVTINDKDNYYNLYKDLFLNQIYRFTPRRAAPLILDCGSNIGMSILYFKSLCRDARIVGFEPDPTVLPYLRENLEQNGILDVEVVPSALTDRAGVGTLLADGKYASCLAHHTSQAAPSDWDEHTVPCVRLYDYLTEPVDFVKMNIEGAEWDVLRDAEERLHHVREMVIEYHHLPGLPRTLHKILDLLCRNGFEYLVNSFDPETNPGGQPPFRLGERTRYFLLIYACRME